MTDDIETSLRRLVESQRTLVLATADPDPWAAPVYFVRYRDRLCFFSSAKSRHVVAALQTGRCAGAIFRDGDGWRDIEGLQMQGRVERVPIGPAALGAFTAYVAKFPTVRDFFAGATFGLAEFAGKFRSELYAFVPEQAFYLNNRLGFGTRQRIAWPAEA